MFLKPLPNSDNSTFIITSHVLKWEALYLLPLLCRKERAKSAGEEGIQGSGGFLCRLSSNLLVFSCVFTVNVQSSLVPIPKHFRDGMV